jgi:hypothetical protein
LLDSGCNVNAADVQGNTAIMLAAGGNCAQMVSLLIARGADVNARNIHSLTALHFACVNCVFASEVIPVLCAAGADVTAESNTNLTAFGVALSMSKAIADALVPFLPPGFKQPTTLLCRQDPVGSLTCALEHGAVVSQRSFWGNVVREDSLWTMSWAFLRTGEALCLDDQDGENFRAVLRSNDTRLWKWASSEPQMQQHPVTGDTVFHLLCRSEALDVPSKLAVLADLRAQYRNPLVPNYRNELCVGLAKEPELMKALLEYACWQPHRLVMHWFGPLFQMRAWALLLVSYRMKKLYPKVLAGLNRDMRHLLVRYASRIEYIYVPSKQQQ